MNCTQVRKHRRASSRLRRREIHRVRRPTDRWPRPIQATPNSTVQEQTPRTDPRTTTPALLLSNLRVIIRQLDHTCPLVGPLFSLSIDNLGYGTFFFFFRHRRVLGGHFLRCSLSHNRLTRHTPITHPSTQHASFPSQQPRSPLRPTPVTPYPPAAVPRVVLDSI